MSRTTRIASEPADGGFTLLELLLAVVILGLVLTTVYGALTRTEFSKRRAEERAELYSAGRQAVLRMANDIEGALPPPSGDRIYFRGTSGNGDAPEMHFVTVNRGGYGIQRVRPGRVLIVYSLDPLPSRRSLYALRREEYLYAAMLAEADGNTQQPTSLEAENEDEQAPTAQATYLLDCPDVPNELALPGMCLPVIGLTFRYYDETVSDWRDEWDSTGNDAVFGRLPSAVEITLTLADEEGGAHDFSTIVDLPLSRGQPTPGATSGTNQPPTGRTPSGQQDDDKN
ncbi:MAG: type II secretion system protein GspJ [Deltaproteobacteria bacterium]|nr:type II secretion system protein GspJ [Deltaproteobacteria bacterium]